MYSLQTERHGGRIAVLLAPHLTADCSSTKQSFTFHSNLSKRRYEHVFDETVALFHDMVTSEKWSDKNEVHTPIFQHLTHKVLPIEI